MEMGWAEVMQRGDREISKAERVLLRSTVHNHHPAIKSTRIIRIPCLAQSSSPVPVSKRFPQWPREQVPLHSAASQGMASSTASADTHEQTDTLATPNKEKWLLLKPHTSEPL